MIRRDALPLLLVLGLSPILAAAQELRPLELPKPQTDGGRPLMQVLRDRHSTREFKPDKLPLQVLSNLLWAAFGINRPETGKRTAPSAMNWQEVDIYVALPEGLYVYDAKAHRLNPILADDVRAATGGQDFVKGAPLNLVYVADLARTKDAGAEEKNFYTTIDVGFIGQNVYLFCASEGLATVVRGTVDRPALAKLMKLRPEQKIIVAQTVGYPKK
jgi:SagB-type dehydrogenase family enzyme